jgi:quercetin dioxygenase-like cupin family protein
MQADVPFPPTILTPQAIAQLPVQPLGTDPGVTHRVLWHDQTSMAGLLTVEAGQRLGGHSHRVNHHHMWVTEGHPRILGEDLRPGSYVHIPSHIHHDIEAPADEACTVLYFYLRPSDGD